MGWSPNKTDRWARAGSPTPLPAHPHARRRGGTWPAGAVAGRWCRGWRTGPPPAPPGPEGTGPPWTGGRGVTRGARPPADARPTPPRSQPGRRASTPPTDPPPRVMVGAGTPVGARWSPPAEHPHSCGHLTGGARPTPLGSPGGARRNWPNAPQQRVPASANGRGFALFRSVVLARLHGRRRRRSKPSVRAARVGTSPAVSARSVFAP
jgi:hypothetical protein